MGGRAAAPFIFGPQRGGVVTSGAGPDIAGDDLARNVAEVRDAQGPDLLQDAVEGGPDVRGGVRHHRDAHEREAVMVQGADLRDRHQVRAVQAVLEGLHDPALVLEGRAPGHHELELEDSDMHRGTTATHRVRLTSTLL